MREEARIELTCLGGDFMSTVEVGSRVVTFFVRVSAVEAYGLAEKWLHEHAHEFSLSDAPTLIHFVPAAGDLLREAEREVSVRRARTFVGLGVGTWR